MKAVIAQVNRHWFVAAALLLAGLAFGARATLVAPLATGAAVAMLVLGLPLAYVLCYGYRPAARTVLRCLMLALLGLWGVSYLYPAPREAWLDTVLVLQHAKWPLVVYLEAKFMLTLWRLVRKGKTVGDACATAATEQGLPAWIGRLAHWEAALWKKLRLAVSSLGKP
jgi:hypothetical protein